MILGQRWQVNGWQGQHEARDNDLHWLSIDSYKSSAQDFMTFNKRIQALYKRLLIHGEVQTEGTVFVVGNITSLQLIQEPDALLCK